VSGRDQRSAIGAEGDRQALLVAAVEGCQLLAGRGVPHAHFLVIAAGDQDLVIGSEAQAPDDVRVPLPFAPDLAAPPMPEDEFPLAVAGRHGLVVATEGDGIGAALEGAVQRLFPFSLGYVPQN